MEQTKEKGPGTGPKGTAVSHSGEEEPGWRCLLKCMFTIVSHLSWTHSSAFLINIWVIVLVDSFTKHIFKIWSEELGMVLHICNSSTLEAEVRKSLQVQDQSEL